MTEKMCRCPSCGSEVKETLRAVREVPKSSQKLFKTYAEALTPRSTGRLLVKFCRACSMIWNDAYEETAPGGEFGQDFYCLSATSPKGRQFQATLATELNDRVGLHGKTVLEIGCGDGYLLSELANLGSRPIGYEPSYGFNIARQRAGVSVFNQYFDFEGHAQISERVDLIIMRHVLEHLNSPRLALQALQRQLFDKKPAKYLYVEVPDASFILSNNLYFDFYYDHVWYFSLPSLVPLLRSAGWIPMARLGDEKEFLGLLCARNDMGSHSDFYADETLVSDLTLLYSAADQFRQGYSEWKERLSEILVHSRQLGEQTAVWGAGTRGITMLCSLELARELLAYVVDGASHKHGLYIPGSGLMIHSPDKLQQDPVENILITSVTYFDEIYRELKPFMDRGGRIIQACPGPRIMTKESA